MSKTPSRRSRRSLRWQLTALVAALAIPLLVLQGWWGYHDYRSARTRAETDALAFADATSLGVVQFFANAEELMTASAAAFGEGWSDPATCRLHIREITRLFPFLANAVAVGPDGSIACSFLDGPTDVDARAWSWFEGIRRDPRFTIGDPVMGTFTNTMILPLVAPVLTPDGRFAGAVVGTVQLTELSRLFGAVRLPPDYLVTVATADRIVISRSHDAAAHVGDLLPEPSGSDRLVAEKRWVATGPDFEGVARTWGQIEIQEGWVVYVGVPDAMVYGPALRAALTHVAATLLVVLVGIGLAAWWYGGIASALRELARRTGDAESGQIVPPPEGTPDEVAAVVEQFNRTLQSRDRAEAAERRARERFQSLFDNAVFGLYVSTTDGRFLQVNPALVAMLKYPSEDALLEAGPLALYADPDRRSELIQQTLESGVPRTEELEWLRHDGVAITVRVAGKLIAGPDGQPVFEMIVQDITREKRTEDELRQTQKMEAIGQLAGGVAHDFNNLLTVIGGNVELLEDDMPVEDPLRDDLDQIAKATKRATSLTRRLLTFSRKQRRRAQPLDVTEVVPELTKLLVPLIGEAVTLRTDLPDAPLWISMDPGELEQTILNLVLNARDAMPKGGEIVISACAAPRPDSGSDVDDGEAREEGVELTVTDSGSGMDPDVIPRIFEPFYTTKPMGAGTGLGLSTVYGVVKRCGGSIRVDSDIGSGTVMTIWLPAAVEEGHGLAHGESELPTTGTETVLVVEDDELVRSFVCRALEEAGYTVLPSPDGESALELQRTRAGEIDLVLSDVVMPGLNGPELAERLEVVAPSTPVLFMSGYVDNEFLSRELDRHPERLLIKPFSATELRARVRRAIDGTLEGAPVSAGVQSQPQT